MIVSTKGAELFYTTRGQGPACLLLTSIGTKPYERQTGSFFEEDASEDRKQVLRENLAGLGPDASMRQFLFAQTCTMDVFFGADHRVTGTFHDH